MWRKRCKEIQNGGLSCGEGERVRWKRRVSKVGKEECLMWEKTWVGWKKKVSPEPLRTSDTLKGLLLGFKSCVIKGQCRCFYHAKAPLLFYKRFLLSLKHQFVFDSVVGLRFHNDVALLAIALYDEHQLTAKQLHSWLCERF